MQQITVTNATQYILLFIQQNLNLQIHQQTQCVGILIRRGG